MCTLINGSQRSRAHKQSHTHAQISPARGNDRAHTARRSRCLSWTRVAHKRASCSVARARLFLCFINSHCGRVRASLSSTCGLNELHAHAKCGSARNAIITNVTHTHSRGFCKPDRIWHAYALCARNNCEYKRDGARECSRCTR